MENTNKTFRIHADTNIEQNIINVNLQQDYDVFEILSLKLTQENAYKLYESNYGVIVGRIVANGGFGIPNAKVSIFIKVSNTDYVNNEKNYLYPYLTNISTNKDGIRYNLLPSTKINDCHQNVGTFPSKSMILDNDTVLEVYDEYWKYTSVTNESGDYMIFGVPTGNQQLHVDIDLSDIGVLSQRPYDMIYKGYNINQFESPNKFKTSTNLESLAQIYSQDKGIYVYPFWGDSEASEMGAENQSIAVTRADVQIQYEFEPTCVFMGSIVTDTNANALGKNCVAYKNLGKMSDLVSGEGTIEMIRKTLNGQVEEFQIKGTRLIDGNGVWCYQIPMNLDYVTTDEYGNMVQTDDPTKGIPTRTRARFRVSLDDSPNDATNRKRCKVLIPNNPQINQTNETEPEKMSEFDKTLTPDYDFGLATWDESYRDMFWNKVYSIKSFVPRLQKGKKTQERKFTGIKMTNHYGSNNPAPYNNVNIKLTLVFRLLCVITRIFIYLITALNGIISTISLLPCAICKILKGIGKIPLVGWIFKQLAKPFCAMIIKCIKIDQGFCDDGINNNTYFPGCYGCAWTVTRDDFTNEETDLINKGEKEPSDRTTPSKDTATLITCVENDLAQENEVTSFDFFNDWVNGTVYAPLWFRYIKKKKSFLFGLFRLKAKDQWCTANGSSSLQIFQPCSLTYQSKGETYKSNNGEVVTPYYDVIANNNPGCFETKKSKRKCNVKKITQIGINTGIIVDKQTILKQTVYYYKPIEYLAAEPGKKGKVLTLFATDIILLGSLTDCDLDGTPQFFKYLEPTTYNMPTDILFTDTDAVLNENNEYVVTTEVESTGADWGNFSNFEQCGDKDDTTDGGLFYGIGCSSVEVMGKSCINLSRVCELGVNLDATQYIQNLKNSSENGRLVADGFVSKDELTNLDARSMFATINSNELKTSKSDTDGSYRYDFHYLYPENFDGSMYNMMKDRQSKCGKSYKYNYEIEQFNEDYYKFRLGNQTKPTYYFMDGNKATMPRYNNSFYFYFGLNPGNTALDKFNSEFYSTCSKEDMDTFDVKIEKQSNTWCDIESGELVGGIKLTFGDMATPYDIIVHNNTMLGSIDRQYTGKTEDVIYIGYAKDDDPRDVDDNEPLANGSYTITIIDKNGSIVEKIVELEAPYLMFDVDSEMSATDNKTLMSIYKNDCNAVRQAKAGAQIIVTNVAVENILMCADGNSCGKERRVYTIKLIELREERDEEGNLIVNEKPVTLTKEEIKTGILQVCQGDRNYKVIVIELCDGEESGNKVEQIIYVGEPGKFKLMINDVDYDIIQKFHTGYDNPDKMNSGGFKGWDKLGQISNPYYTWTEEINNMKFDLKGKINNATGKIYTDKEIDEAILLAKQDIIINVKNGFWVTCKDKAAEMAISGEFGKPVILYQMAYGKEVLTEDDTQSNGYRVDIENVPIENVQYIDDVQVPTLLAKTDKSGGTIVGGYGMLNPKKKPYFVAAFSNYTDDGKYGANNARRPASAKVNDNKTFFGVHLIDKIFDLNFIAWAWVKDLHIYKVFKPEKDNSGYEPSDESDINFDDISDITIDVDGGITARTASGINVSTANVKITSNAAWVKPTMADAGTDKINVSMSVDKNDGGERRAQVTISSTVTGGTGGDPDDPNEYNAGNYGGFLQGTIFNGITKRVNNKNMFESITCGNVIPEYYHGTEVEEDALPTVRKILGPPYKSSNTRFECLTKEGIMRLPYSDCTFDITDYSSCGLAVDIHPKMNIRIVSAYGDKVLNNNKLKVNISNGGEDIRYVLLNEYDDSYPFPKFDPCTGAIYKADVTTEMIENRGIIQKWDDGLGEGEKDHHYTTDGSFTFDGEKPVYVVAYDKDGCRTLSEVYDFSLVTATIDVTVSPEDFETDVTVDTTGQTTNPDTGELEDTNESLGGTGTTNVKKYGLKVKLSTDHWYLSTYTSIIKVTVGNESGNVENASDNVSFTGILKGKTIATDESPLRKACIVEINGPIATSINDILGLPKGLKDDMLRKLVLVEAVDVLGVTIKCKINGGDKINLK